MSLKASDEIFFLIHCEKNSDGTRNLVLQGNNLYLQFQKRLWENNVTKISYFLKKFDKVTSLNLCYNDIGNEGFKNLINFYLIEENNLERLNVNYCDITEEGITYLCDTVKNFTVHDFRLSGNEIGAKGGQDLALFLDKNTHVEYLDLGQTDQTLSSIAYFMKILNFYQGSNKTLKVLDISRIIPSFDKYNYNDVHLADSISMLLSANHCLVELHLQKCQLDGHDIEQIADGLKFNKTLLFLDIGYNRIGDHGIEVLAEHLKARPPLIGLNVAGNQIKDTGARALSFAMPHSKIRLLDIGHNKLSPSAVADILNSIKKPVQIRILNIWGNSFNHDCNTIMKRMFTSRVLDQNYVDVKIYEVDGKNYAAYNPSDRYKHKYYCELDYACAVMLKIKKNKIVKRDHDRINFKFYPIISGYEPVTRKLKKHGSTCKCCFCDI